jgi:hypothetical protein
VLQSFQSRNSVQNPPERVPSGGFPVCHVVLFLVRVLLQKSRFRFFLHLAGGLKKLPKSVSEKIGGGKNGLEGKTLPGSTGFAIYLPEPHCPSYQ